MSVPSRISLTVSQSPVMQGIFLSYESLQPGRGQKLTALRKKTPLNLIEPRSGAPCHRRDSAATMQMERRQYNRGRMLNRALWASMKNHWLCWWGFSLLPETNWQKGKVSSLNQSWVLACPIAMMSSSVRLP